MAFETHILFPYFSKTYVILLSGELGDAPIAIIDAAALLLFDSKKVSNSIRANLPILWEEIRSSGFIMLLKL